MATNVSAGSGSLLEKNDPVDHDTDAPSMSASPIACEPPETPLGITIKASPARPTMALSLVAVAIRSRASVRQRMTWSGTEPAIMAAMLESIRVSASVTTPTPRPSSATPRAAAAPASRHGTRSRVRRSARIAASSNPATMNRRPAERSAGIVRTVILIARYVDPQTM